MLSHPCHDERLALPVAEGALLWSMRAWVAGLRHAVPSEQRIAEVMARLGTPRATGYLLGFMFTLRHGAVRAIRVSCPCQPRVSADEQALLGVFALAQDGQSFEAMLALRGLVTPAAAAAAYQSAEGVAGELLRAGWLLTPPESDAARHYALATEARPGWPAGAVIH